MIQRIQSIFLVLVAILMFAVIFLPIWGKQAVDSDQVAMLSAIKMTHQQGGEIVNSVHTFYIAIASFLSSAVAIGSLLSFRNRVKQMGLNMINTLLMITVIGLNILFLFKGTVWFEEQNQGQFGIGFYLPAAALFFNMFANRFIRKDEKLVKSADRIR